MLEAKELSRGEQKRRLVVAKDHGLLGCSVVGDDAGLDVLRSSNSNCCGGVRKRTHTHDHGLKDGRDCTHTIG